MAILIAQEYAIKDNTKTDGRKWIQKYKENQEEPFVGSGNLRSDNEAIRDMEKKLRDLEEENAILKKARRS